MVATLFRDDFLSAIQDEGWLNETLLVRIWLIPVTAHDAMPSRTETLAVRHWESLRLAAQAERDRATTVETPRATGLSLIKAFTVSFVLLAIATGRAGWSSGNPEAAVANVRLVVRAIRRSVGTAKTLRRVLDLLAHYRSCLQATEAELRKEVRTKSALQMLGAVRFSITSISRLRHELRSQG